MARTKTLTEICTECLDRADVDSNFIPTAEQYSMVNASLAELYDLLVSLNKNYFLSSSTVSVVSGTEAYALPADFWRAIGVDVTDNGLLFSMPRFNWPERNMYQQSGAARTNTFYHIMGSNIRFMPTPNWSGSVTLWYIPAPPVLTAGGDTWDGYAGWEEYAIVDVVIKIRAKQEESATTEMRQKQDLVARITRSANERDDHEPPRIRDVYREAVVNDMQLGWRRR